MAKFNWTVEDIERAQRDFSYNFMRLDCIRTESYDVAIDCMTECIEKKAEDVQREIHAYWIRGKEFGFKTHNPMWYCSNCGGGIRYNTTLRTYEKHKKPVEEVNCFCRKCGAKMDLEPIYEREES